MKSYAECFRFEFIEALKGILSGLIGIAILAAFICLLVLTVYALGVFGVLPLFFLLYVAGMAKQRHRKESQQCAPTARVIRKFE